MSAVAAVVLGLIVPGLAGGIALSALSPEPARWGVLLTRSLSAGLALWLTTMELLARTVGLSPAACWSATGSLAAAGLAVLLLPGSRRILALAWRDVMFGCAIAVLAYLIWLPVGLANARVSWSPLGSTPWYYWGLARQIAAAGHVPTWSVEWGINVPFLRDYQAFSIGTAALIDQTPAGTLMALHAVVVITLITAACGATLLAMALGARPAWAVVAVPFFLGIAVFVRELSSYRPEAFAYGLALLAGTNAIHWLRDRDRGAFIAGAFTVAVLTEVHAVVLVIAAALAGAGIVAFLPGSRCRELGGHARRAGGFVAVCVALAAGLAVVAGTQASTEHVHALSSSQPLGDPTWSFMRTISSTPDALPPANGELTRAAVASWFRGPNPWGIAAAFTVGLLVLVTVAGRGRRSAGAHRHRRSPVTAETDAAAGPSARTALVFGIAFVTLMGAVAAVFALGWSTYVPRRTGAGRLVQLIPFVLPSLAACAVSAFRRLAPGRAGGLAAVAAAGAVLTGTLAANVHAEHQIGAQHPSSDTIEALSRLRLPANSVVLANGYTEGFIAQTLGGKGLLDGRAPYTFPDMLNRANSLLGEATAFFASPARHADFLRDHDVGYVLVARRRTWALGTSNIFPARRADLARLPALRPMVATSDFVLYRVKGRS